MVVLLYLTARACRKTPEETNTTECCAKFVFDRACRKTPEETNTTECCAKFVFDSPGCKI